MQNFGATNKEDYGMLWYFLESSIAVFHVTSRRPCWWSKQKHFSPLGTKLNFHVNSSSKKSTVLTPNMTALSRGCNLWSPVLTIPPSIQRMFCVLNSPRICNQMTPYQRVKAGNKRWHSCETSVIETTDTILNAIDKKEVNGSCTIRYEQSL